MSGKIGSKCCALPKILFKIDHNNTNVSLSRYIKPTKTDTVIQISSNVSYSIKLYAFHSLLHRMHKDFQEELRTIKYIVYNNGYNISLIDKLLKKKEKTGPLNVVYKGTKTPSNNKLIDEFNFIHKTSNKVKRKLHSFDIQTTQVNKRNLQYMLVNSKRKMDNMEKSGIYQIICRSRELGNQEKDTFQETYCKPPPGNTY